MNFLNFISLVFCNQFFIYTYKSHYENEYKQKLEHNMNQHIIYFKNKKVINTKCFSNKSYGRLIAATDFIYYFNKVNFPNISLFQQLIDTYCKQTMFLSSVTSITQSYCNKMIKLDPQIAKKIRKKRIFNFNKALFNYDIVVNTLIKSYLHENGKLSVSRPIQYVWRKSVNLSGIFSNLVKPNYNINVSNFSISFAQLLKTIHVPLFTITNNYKQLVIAEPSEAVFMKNRIKNIIFRWPYYTFVSGQDQAGIYESWFFINPQDANEYKTYIASQYQRSYNQNGLNLFVTGIHFYYRLNRISAPRIHFRLLPDLTEVSNLVMNYRYGYKVEFDRKQNHGKNYFQGQPIYFIKPIIYRQRQFGKDKMIYCHYQISENKSQKKYYPIFFNRKVALNTWKKFRQVMKRQNISLPKNPILHIYNLEDFLRDTENSNYWIRSNFLLVPSSESYRLIKSVQINNYNKLPKIFSNIQNITSFYLYFSKSWSRRIIWSLTNKKPPC